MARFIEEFYYGNIDPQVRSTKQNKTVQMRGVSSMANQILTVLLWGFASVPTSLTMLSSQPKRPLRTY